MLLLLASAESVLLAPACYTATVREMASTYRRPNSPFIWIRFKDETGKWRGKATGYRGDNPGDVRQAKMVARRHSETERIRTPHSTENWDVWVDAWMSVRYASRDATTWQVYGRYWRHLRRWMELHGISAPAQLLYRHVQEYRAHRMEEEGAANNAVIQELKFLGVVMGEAVRRGFAKANPFTRMGLQKAPAKEKSVWTDAEIRKVAAAIGEAPHWMQVTFLLGLYQAARLRQCAVPLDDVDLDRKRITYRKTKGNKPFTQPLDARAVEPLRKLIAIREAAGEKMLCTFPVLPSLEWRRFLDGLELFHLVHHGLRVTWITRAAKGGKVTLSQAKRFVNHGSSAVHALYQKLNADDVAHVPAALDLPEL